MKLLANEDQSYDSFRDSVKNKVPLVHTVKDKKGKGKKKTIG